MLDLKFIRQNRELVEQGIANKRVKIDFARLLELDEKRRGLLVGSESLKAERNQANQEIANAKKQGGPGKELIERMKEVAGRVKELDAELAAVEQELDTLLLTVPNLPHVSTPVGASEADNVVVRCWGEKPDLSWRPKPHWEVAESLGLADFGAATKLSGSGFCLFTGAGALLERALINWMIYVHVT